MRQRIPRELVKFRADPLLRRAIRLRAALQDANIQDVIVNVLQKGLSAEIAEVERRGLAEGHPAASGSKKRGRKRKDDSQQG
jgi:hypothetical protein